MQVVRWSKEKKKKRKNIFSEKKKRKKKGKNKRKKKKTKKRKKKKEKRKKKKKKNKRKKKKRRKKTRIRKKEEKVKGLKGVPPETAPKGDFKKNVVRNREEIEAKKSDLEHPTKREKKKVGYLRSRILRAASARDYGSVHVRHRPFTISSPP